MKISNSFILTLFVSLVILASCSKNSNEDGSTQLVTDHSKKYLGDYYFTTVETNYYKNVLQSDTTYFSGTVNEYPNYFAFVDINYAPGQNIWTQLDTVGNLIIFANGPFSQLWSGQFINENEIAIVYDSLPFFSKSIHGVRE